LEGVVEGFAFVWEDEDGMAEVKDTRIRPSVIRHQPSVRML
jgi:hypothetical protein